MDKYQVCPVCEGEGYVSKLGAFTGADMDEWFGDDTTARDDFTEEYTRRGGGYDQRCDACKGQRVITPQGLAEYEQDAQYRREYESAGSYGY